MSAKELWEYLFGDEDDLGLVQSILFFAAALPLILIFLLIGDWIED